MKLRRIITGVLIFVICLCQSMTAFASEAKEAEDSDSARNLFMAGEDVLLPSDPFFSTFSMGRKVIMEGSEAEGSVFAMAQDITIDNSKIGESAYIMGETVTVRNTPVHGNIFAMGRNIDIAGESNAVYAMGESIEFDGVTNGLYVQGESVVLSGKIIGDATVEYGSSLTLDPDMEITGNLKVKGKTETQVPETAKVGSYEFEQKIEEKEEDVTPTIGAIIAGKIAKTIFWIVAMSLFGLLLCWLFNDHIIRAGECIMKEPGKAVARGLLGWICTPIIIIFMFCTVILAPAGALLLMVYIILLCAGTAFAGASIGRLIFPKLHPFLASVACIAALEVLRQIPYIGTLVGVVADLYLLSYVVGCISDGINKKNKGTQPVLPEKEAESS